MGQIFFNVFIAPILIAIFIAIVFGVGIFWVWCVVTFFHWVFGGYIWTHFPLIHLIGIPATILYIGVFGVWWINRD